MTRHSKNNTASSFFTSAEREKLKYGTQRQRLGRDSMRDFDACFLCLSTARDPLCCPKGHLACKECFYENILAQKKDIERALKQAEAQKRQAEEEEKEKIRQAQEILLKEFEQTLTNVRADTKHTTLANAASEDVLKRALEMKPEDIEARHKQELQRALDSLDKEARERAKARLPSFWIPHLTPEAKQNPIEVEKTRPMCTGSAEPHPLSLKKLIPVRFASTLDDLDDPDAASKTAEERRKTFFCPACSKSLNNAIKMSLSKNCGHVLCSRCMDQFVRKSQRCFVCEKKCKDKDIIQLVTEGTGFAAGGGQVEVVRYDTAFLG